MHTSHKAPHYAVFSSFLPLPSDYETVPEGNTRDHIAVTVITNFKQLLDIFCSYRLAL